MLDLISKKLILPSPSAPFQNLSLGDISAKVAKFKLPNVYRPQEKSPNSKDTSLPKDLWLFQDATKEDPNKDRGGHYSNLPKLSIESHDCALRKMVTSSLKGILNHTSGLDLSKYR